MKKLVAEFIGTFALVFCGTGAIVVDQHTGGSIGNTGIAITFGLIVTAMICTFGDESGAHFNPAVTLGFSIAKKFDRNKIMPYILSQLAGAFLATLVLKLLFPLNQNLGATIPSGSASQSLVMEFILTFILMLVILNVSSGTMEKGITAAFAIGATVGLEAMFAGPVCGASMNPARSISPAVISGQMNLLWIYILAPLSGSSAASILWKWMNRKHH